MFISHFHDPEDGFPNLEDMYDDGSSISSVVKKSPVQEPDIAINARISATVRHILISYHIMLIIVRILSI
jgi:hypothetical protein